TRTPQPDLDPPEPIQVSQQPKGVPRWWVGWGQGAALSPRMPWRSPLASAKGISQELAIHGPGVASVQGMIEMTTGDAEASQFLQAANDRSLNSPKIMGYDGYAVTTTTWTAGNAQCGSASTGVSHSQKCPVKTCCGTSKTCPGCRGTTASC